jgi:hypothetical protein
VKHLRRRQKKIIKSGDEDKQQSRWPVEPEIAGAAPVIPVSLVAWQKWKLREARTLVWWVIPPVLDRTQVPPLWALGVI